MMTQRRLNKTLRNTIVNNVVEHSIKEMQSKHDEMLKQWVEKVRLNSLDGKESEYLNTINEINKLAEKLPDSIFSYNIGYRDHMYIHTDGYTVSYTHEGNGRKLSPYRVYVESKQLCKEHLKIRKLCADIDSKREEVNCTITGLLSQFTSVNKLIEEYPDLKQFVPEVEVKVTGTGLALTPGDLKKMINL